MLEQFVISKLSENKNTMSILKREAQNALRGNTYYVREEKTVEDRIEKSNPKI